MMKAYSELVQGQVLCSIQERASSQSLRTSTETRGQGTPMFLSEVR